MSGYTRLGTSEAQSSPPLAPAPHLAPAWTAAWLSTPQPPASGSTSWAPLPSPLSLPLPYSFLCDATSTKHQLLGFRYLFRCTPTAQVTPGPHYTDGTKPPPRHPASSSLCHSSPPPGKQHLFLGPGWVLTKQTAGRGVSLSSDWRRLKMGLCLSPLTSG